MDSEKSPATTRPALPLLHHPKPGAPPTRCCLPPASRRGRSGHTARAAVPRPTGKTAAAPAAEASAATVAVTVPSDRGRERFSTCRRNRTRNLLARRVPPGMREAGLATAEYAIVTLAAVGFAALLVAVLSSGEIRGMLMSLITNALSFG